MHSRGRLSRSAFFIAKDDDMRRARLANVRLHQHGNATSRGDPFSSLQRARSRYSIERGKLIINHVARDECVRVCACNAVQRQTATPRTTPSQDQQTGTDDQRYFKMNRATRK